MGQSATWAERVEQKIADVLTIRSGGHFEAVRDHDFKDDATAVLEAIRPLLKEAR